MPVVVARKEKLGQNVVLNHQAYIATTTTGNQNFGGELGLEFKVNNAAGIIINQLGAFDHQANGITGTQSGGIRVAIFNKTTKTIVPGLDAIIIGSADSYSGNHRMKNNHWTLQSLYSCHFGLQQNPDWLRH